MAWSACPHPMWCRCVPFPMGRAHRLSHLLVLLTQKAACCEEDLSNKTGGVCSLWLDWGTGQPELAALVEGGEALGKAPAGSSEARGHVEA